MSAVVIFIYSFIFFIAVLGFVNTTKRVKIDEDFAIVICDFVICVFESSNVNDSGYN